MDFDPTSMSDVCDTSSSLGDLFTKNIGECANCVRNQTGLNTTYYDGKDAQQTLKVVNLCQSDYPTNHSEMVSAMSVISKYGKMSGTIAPHKATSSPTRTPTSVPTTATPTGSHPPAGNQNPRVKSKSWIAGAVIGPIAAAGVALGVLLFVLRRQRKGQGNKISSKNASFVYEKTELPAQGNQRVELPTEHAVEAAANPAPQELESNFVAELPAREAVHENEKGP